MILPCLPFPFLQHPTELWTNHTVFVSLPSSASRLHPDGALGITVTWISTTLGAIAMKNRTKIWQTICSSSPFTLSQMQNQKRHNKPSSLPWHKLTNSIHQVLPYQLGTSAGLEQASSNEISSWMRHHIKTCTAWLCWTIQKSGGLA